MINNTKRFGFIIFITINLFLVGCGSLPQKPAKPADTNSLYKGKLSRLNFYLTPGSDDSSDEDMANKLKEYVLDQHFFNSQNNTYEIDIRAKKWDYKCTRIGKKILTHQINSELKFITRQISPFTKELYVSETVPFSKVYTRAGSCYGQREIYKKEFKEEILTKATKLLSLLMSKAEGKDIEKEFETAISQLHTNEKATFAVFYVSAVHGAFSGIEKVFGGTSPVGTYDIGVPYNSGNSNNTLEIMRENQRAMDDARANQALYDAGYNPSSSTSGSSRIHLTPESYPGEVGYKPPGKRTYKTEWEKKQEINEIYRDKYGCGDDCADKPPGYRRPDGQATSNSREYDTGDSR